MSYLTPILKTFWQIFLANILVINKQCVSLFKSTKSDHKLAIFAAPYSGLGGGDSTDRTSQANLRKLNFTKPLYQLAYSQVLLQHLNRVSVSVRHIYIYILIYKLKVKTLHIKLTE
jgi:hypothetical protein